MKRFLPFLMAFMLCLSMAVPAFAGFVTGKDGQSFSTVYMVDDKTYDFAEHYTANKSMYPNLQYILLYNSNLAVKYHLLRCNDGFYVTTDTKSIFMTNGTAADQFKWDSTNEVWVYIASPAGVNRYFGGYTVLWASDDLLYNDGSVYFEGDENFPIPPTPLAEQIMGVTGETLATETVPALGGTMKVLVLCGVGLIASLVVLKLFGKRSLIFRS